MPDQEERPSLLERSPLTGVAWILAIIVLLHVGSGFFVYFFLPGWAARGSFGDMFGFAGSLFSGLALAGVVVAILLQRQELSLQRQELALTRHELERSADAQQASSDLLKKQLTLAEEARDREVTPIFRVVDRSTTGSGEAGQVRLDFGLENIGPVVRNLNLLHAEPGRVVSQMGGDVFGGRGEGMERLFKAVIHTPSPVQRVVLTLEWTNAAGQRRSGKVVLSQGRPGALISYDPPEPQAPPPPLPVA